MSAGADQTRSFFLVAEGLFEKSDSIGFDCVYQYGVLKKLFPAADVRIFARRFCPDVHPGLAIESIERLYDEDLESRDALLIYHFCDGWASFEDWLVAFQGRVVVRWHNNTPPWFFIHRRDYAERTIRGYESILRLSSRDDAKIWCNSEFSVRQLAHLNVEAARCTVVYPGSRYLCASHHATLPTVGADQDPGVVRVAFVGRVVPHKGHRHVLLAASELQKLTGQRVVVYFAGRTAIDEYVSELESISRHNGVEMHILNEVSEAELMALYRSVRCLLYLSEHEGFGLPIYEAMRVGVPVIAWLATAVEEIMYNHPLAVERMDYDRIAAKIALLANDEIRSRVVEWQNTHILPLYSSSRIEDQIFDACDAGPLRSERAETSCSLFRDELETVIDDILVDAGPGSAFRDVPKEIKGNFVTLHDIAAYRMLLNDEFSGRLDQNRADSHEILKLPISRFSRKGGLQCNGALVFDLQPAGGHLVFGPFLKLPAGSFSLRFLVDVVDLPSYSGVMRFEAATVDQSLADVETSCDDFRDGWTPEVQFTLDSPTERIEFRIHVSDWPTGTLTFSGVELRRIPGIDTIVEMFHRTPDIKVEYKPRKHWSWLFQQHSDAAGHAPESARYRDLGDAARDREHWSEALAHYKRHLKEHPSDVQILTQAGNCAKESGRFREAERFYAAALSILPTDVDINVQLGHLAKLRGRKSDAASFFARAMNLGRGAFDAERELRDIGAGR